MAKYPDEVLWRKIFGNLGKKMRRDIASWCTRTGRRRKKMTERREKYLDSQILNQNFIKMLQLLEYSSRFQIHCKFLAAKEKRKKRTYSGRKGISRDGQE